MNNENISAALAQKLLELDADRESVRTAAEILSSEEIRTALLSPDVTAEEKLNIAQKAFPAGIGQFILDNPDCIGLMDDISERFERLKLKRLNAEKCTLYCVAQPDEKTLDELTEKIKEKLGLDEAVIEVVIDKSLIGGYVLEAGGMLYDKSLKTSVKKLRNELAAKGAVGKRMSRGDIISMLKSEIDSFEAKMQVSENGTVISIHDGIVNVFGLNNAMFGELVEFETGVKAIVQNINENSIGCVLLGADRGLHEGSRVVRTGKRAGVPVGEKFIGRVINALGAPIDGLGDIREDDYYPVENEAPGVCIRKPVSTPLQTGILAIDSMFPIGRGQRELIIGDRQTGKTSIAVDTIINQKDQDMICVYVAIGQKASTVAKVVSDLKKHGAMDHTIVVAAMASDIAPLQWIAPYSGTAIAEYFMHQGKDVLIVYDDLSKHAAAYRAMSLLLERSPGREAYPGDVFYLHSRLLERSSRLDDEHGGGSITALPIIETQAGDVSAYIPTNVISITDGQIFLESQLFFAGVRPAVNVGLSVSRVGGAAQTKAMKKVAGTLRIDLAQYREMEVFTQFSSDLDKTTKEMLDHGDRLMELLKQPLYRPLPLHEQVILLCLADHKLMQDVPVNKISEFRQDIINYFETAYSDIVDEIDSTGRLPDELENRIIEAAKEFKAKNS